MVGFKRLIAQTAVFLALVGPAVADELALGQTSVSPWAGLYVGASGGVVMAGESEWKRDDGVSFSPGFDNGQIFGAQAGYLFQWGAVVAGAEISYSGTNDLKGSTSCPNAVFTCRNEIDNLLLVNGRLGYGFGRSLVYGTGGYARADVGAEATRPDRPDRTATGEDTATGWNLGIGFEHAFSNTIILGVEYLHVDLAQSGIVFGEVGRPPSAVDFDATLDLVRLRLSVSIDGLSQAQ